MAVPYFVWNGVDSRAMGLVVTEYPPLTYPAERVEQVTIPGRPGFLTKTQGEGIYDGYLVSIGIGNRAAADPRVIAAWLRGAGELVLGSEPDRVYFGRVIKEASLERVMRGVYSGTVAFMVQPGKGQWPPEADFTTTGRHAGLYNPGDLVAKPIYTVTAGTDTTQIALYLNDHGAITDPPANYSHVIVALDGTDYASETVVVIDSDSGMVTTSDGSASLNSITKIYYNSLEGLWIPPHATLDIDVVGTYQSQVKVTPRWRWL